MMRGLGRHHFHSKIGLSHTQQKLPYSWADDVLLVLLFFTPVRLEADGEENEGHVRRRDREPRDQPVLEHRHPATQQRLHFQELLSSYFVLLSQF